MSITRNTAAAGLVLVGLVGQGAAYATPFDCSSEPGYCVGEGDTVVFRFAGSSSSMGLFGALEVVGDSVVSYPTEFRAESSGSVQDGINDNGTVQVFAKAGYRFDAVTIVERGAYSMSAADSSVDVTAFMSVADHNDPLFGAYDDANLGLTAPLNIQDGQPHAWRMSGSVDLSGSLWDGVDVIDLSLLNNLYATGGSGTAWIEKLVSGAGLDVSIVTTPVPLPAAIWLLGAGLLGLGGVRRRRR